jgi:hypothetical protein
MGVRWVSGGGADLANRQSVESATHFVGESQSKRERERERERERWRWREEEPQLSMLHGLHGDLNCSTLLSADW